MHSPTLWNFLYDDVLRLEMMGDMSIIGFADDHSRLIGLVKENVPKIKRWVRRNKLTLEKDKPEIVVLKGRRSWKHLKFTFDGLVLKLFKVVRQIPKW